MPGIFRSIRHVPCYKEGGITQNWDTWVISSFSSVFWPLLIFPACLTAPELSPEHFLFPKHVKGGMRPVGLKFDTLELHSSICKPMIQKFVSILDLFPECQTHLYNCLLDIVPYVFNRHHKVKMTKSGLLIWLSKCVLPLAFSVTLNRNPNFNCSSQKTWSDLWLFFFSHI